VNFPVASTFGATVTRTRPLSASQLVEPGGCWLRAILASEKYPTSLPAHPIAQLGTAVHACLADATLIAKAKIGDTQPILDSIDGAMQKVLPACHRLRVYRDNVTYSQVVSRSVVDARVRMAVRLVLARADAVSGGGGKSQTRVREERKLVSDTLQLIGKPDRVVSRGDHCSIIDYKTGSIGEEGQIPEEIRAQLGAYALLAEEIGYTVQELIVRHPDGDLRMEWTDDARTSLRSSIERVLAMAPIGVKSDAGRLMRRGTGCTRCQFRRSCPAYLADLSRPEHNRTGPVASGDVAGTVVACRQVVERLHDIELLTGGRHCIIENVPLTIEEVAFLDSYRGTMLAFGLRRVQSGASDARTSTELYIVHRKRLWESAVTACVMLPPP